MPARIYKEIIMQHRVSVRTPDDELQKLKQIAKDKKLTGVSALIRRAVNDIIKEYEESTVQMPAKQSTGGFQW